jgi:hypothetical protein
VWETALACKVRPFNQRFVVGPDGYAICLADLPPTPPRRWLRRRKAQVVAAVEGGLLTIEQACGRYHLTPNQFLDWQVLVHDGMTLK